MCTVGKLLKRPGASAVYLIAEKEAKTFNYTREKKSVFCVDLVVLSEKLEVIT